MTDNEIISISEEYVRRQCENRCEMKNCDACMVNYVKQTIEIARNQKAEVERLQNERIERIRELTREVYDTEIAEAKFEAIKEFARELKCGVPQETGVIRCKDVDNLVKEMVGKLSKINHDSLCETETYKVGE